MVAMAAARKTVCAGSRPPMLVVEPVVIVTGRAGEPSTGLAGTIPPATLTAPGGR